MNTDWRKQRRYIVVGLWIVLKLNRHYFIFRSNHRVMGRPLRKSNLKLAPVSYSKGNRPTRNATRSNGAKTWRKPFPVGGEKATAINKTRDSFINLVISIANKVHCSSTAVTNVSRLRGFYITELPATFPSWRYLCLNSVRVIRNWRWKGACN